MILIFLLLLGLELLLPRPIFAIYDPLSVPNNKYGMHIADFNDIADVAPLVNSTGGDWGYVTLVASDNDRDSGRWQTMFDMMRRLHLIPLVRLATHPEGASWAKPQLEKFTEFVNFLDGLNWPTQNRYVILYNEPNHAKEWGNSIDPEGYALTALTLSRKLKDASADFFVMLAGLDASAGDALALDAVVYLKRMVTSQPNLFDNVDGWVSHAYPNPAFSGSPYATGRGTLYTHHWELAYLKSLGVTKQLPVFITETGWIHEEGKHPEPHLLSTDQVGANLLVAAAGPWKDPNVVAVTPFVFNYQDVPFDHFSWKKLGADGFYSHYETYKQIEKTKGEPKQIESYVVLETLLPAVLVANSTYSLSSIVRNEGQGILDNDGYQLTLEGETGGFSFFADALPTIEPGDEEKVSIHLKTPAKPGTYPLKLMLTHNGRETTFLERSVNVIPPPAMTIQAKLGWRTVNSAGNVKVLVYKDKDLLQKFTGLTLRNGAVRVTGITNIVPDEKYRVVIVVPYYLPRQTIVALGPEDTVVPMKRLLPLDIDNDGALTVADFTALFNQRPHAILPRFFGP